MIATKAKLFDSPGKLEAHRAKLSKARAGKPCLIVSSGTCGMVNGSGALVEALQAGLKELRLTGKVLLRVTGCLGFCEQEPLLILRPSNIFYPHPAPKDVPRLLKESLLGGKVIEEWCYRDPRTGEAVRDIRRLPFYERQQRLVLGMNAEVDPCSIEDYIAAGGYAAWTKVLAGGSPRHVIDEIERSGLRGRGGGGFPTGRKWRICRDKPGDKKYVVCNADEGDPGAYMNRSVLEGNPHSVLEGMLIGGYAIGADEAVIYVRAEYPLAVRHVLAAIEQAKAHGLVGENILGSGWNFQVHVSRGAGAFVCGEERP